VENRSPPEIGPRYRQSGLTPTELRVLRFLPTNMSRTEIARALYLSVNTFNTHVRNIYARLACAFDRRRTIAGIELRLVSASASR
jgi:LuxR family transcriptional regulator, maltose regulon positive regulatory protein